MVHGAALFISAAAGLILEITAARLIAPYVGMSLYTWTAIIAVVLAGMSLGHWIGGRCADAPDEKIFDRMIVFSAISAVTIALVPAELRWLGPALLEGSRNILMAVSLLTLGLFFLPSLFIAALSPMLTRLAIDRQPDRRGAVLGRMFALGSAGAIFGTIAAGFFFISWIGTTGTIISIAQVI